jgi:DNA-binding transcriptional MerR regulator
MQHTLKGLIPEYQEIIRLRAEGFTLEQIGEFLGGKSKEFVSGELRKMKRRGMGSFERAPIKRIEVIHDDFPAPTAMKDKCRYTSCNIQAGYTWALIPLCPGHYELIHDETRMYYDQAKNKVKTHEEREYYAQISNMIPWRMKLK